MSTVIVIPARFGSSRFPGKPLASICGKTMIRRVWEVASAVSAVDGVHIATDDERIAAEAAAFGASALMTSESCRNGSERVFEAAQALSPRPQIVINLQGDAVLTPPGLINDLALFMQRESAAQIGTVAVKLPVTESAAARSAPQAGRSGTFVVFDRQHRALYFSRAVIPHQRADSRSAAALFKHVGVYAYRFPALERYVKLTPTPLEEAEKLEQLRALEHGIPISVVEYDLNGRALVSVDHPDDIAKVEAHIAAHGELLGG